MLGVDDTRVGKKPRFAYEASLVALGIVVGLILAIVTLKFV